MSGTELKTSNIQSWIDAALGNPLLIVCDTPKGYVSNRSATLHRESNYWRINTPKLDTDGDRNAFMLKVFNAFEQMAVSGATKIGSSS